MKVLHVITSLDVGGAQEMLYKLLYGSQRGVLEERVISLKGPGTYSERIRKLKVPVQHLDMEPGRLAPARLLPLAAQIDEYRPDLIHAWMYHAALAAMLASRIARSNARLIWNLRHSLYGLGLEKKTTALVIRLGALSSRWVDLVIFNSRTSQAQHLSAGYRPRCSSVLPNGFDLDQWRPNPCCHGKLCDQLELASSTLLIGLVARFHPMKDHSTFFEAASQIASERADVHFVLVGSGVEPSNNTLMRMIREKGLAGRCSLLGEIEGVPDIIAGLDIASLTSAWGEAFPNVVGEAMACGIPCVVTDIGDSAMLVGEAGCVVPPGDSCALASAWRTLLQIGGVERRRMGMAGRRKIAEKYSLERAVRQYHRLYEELLHPYAAT